MHQRRSTIPLPPRGSTIPLPLRWERLGEGNPEKVEDPARRLRVYDGQTARSSTADAFNANLREGAVSPQSSVLSPQREPERILVVKLADLGDLLTATPALRALRLRFPRAEITALVTPHTACLLEGNDTVDRVIPFPKARYDRLRDLLRPAEALTAGAGALALGRRLRAGRYDALLLLHHLVTPWGAAKYRALALAAAAPVRAGLDNGRGSFLTHRVPDEGFGARHEADYALAVAATLGAHNPEPALELYLRPGELAAADARWEAAGLEGHEVVAVHPGSGLFSVARRWPPERFAAVGDALAAEGLHVAVVAGPEEEPVARHVQESMRAQSVVLAEVGSPRDLAAILRRCRLFVGNDSGIMHCAATMGVPVAAVFGLSNHRAWGPYPPALHRVVRLDLPCSPCFYRGQGLGTPEGCPPRTCLAELEPRWVLAAARELLGVSPTPTRQLPTPDP